MKIKYRKLKYYYKDEMVLIDFRDKNNLLQGQRLILDYHNDNNVNNSISKAKNNRLNGIAIKIDK